MARVTFFVHFLAVFSTLVGPILNLNIFSNAANQWPLHDNGLNKVVQWDHYSYMINGERLFLFGGEVTHRLYLRPRDI